MKCRTLVAIVAASMLAGPVYANDWDSPRCHAYRGVNNINLKNGSAMQHIFDAIRWAKAHTKELEDAGLKKWTHSTRDSCLQKVPYAAEIGELVGFALKLPPSVVAGAAADMVNCSCYGSY